MTFKDNINRLCKLHGTNLTTLIKECGFSSSKATAINKGQIPTEEQQPSESHRARYNHGDN